jgi:hypothetical protein
MAVGAFFAGLGYALVFGSLSVASLATGATENGLRSVIPFSDAFSLSFWLFWVGIVLFPVGLAILAYGVGARESKTEIPTPPQSP